MPVITYMVELFESDNGTTIIRLTPNRSATWLNTKWLMLIMTVFVLLIATAWAFAGAWVILPFAGLEVGLLVFIMYRVSQKTYRSETVKLCKDRIIVESQLSAKQRQRLTLPRRELHLEVEETEQDWQLPDMQLITPQQTLHIGKFLNLNDRKCLMEHLRNAGVPMCRTHWWKNH
ncbi:DUF2244 domain-containing protein [Alteromonas flava]|uniref:DUF2244 domain-containing protein n=1 Tax=Alteromonas flava TaxID=2048003 RepID=UPI0013DD1A4C|nr:DUF2244 domain-containing protein [Alteromonas flava]